MKVIDRIHVEKKKGFDIESQQLRKEFVEILGINNIDNIRVVIRYDMELENREPLGDIVELILSEPNVDLTYDNIDLQDDENVVAIEYLPGQYDQRADSASQCIQIMTQDMNVNTRVAKLIVIKGNISEKELALIKNYSINPVDSREATMRLPNTIKEDYYQPKSVAILEGFTSMEDIKMLEYVSGLGLAMGEEDALFVRDYFLNEERRDPTITELKVIDTYWSDHCRHTTFLTELQKITIEEGKYKTLFENVFNDYIKTREELGITKPMTLMDLATINMKQAKKNGLLNDLDQSEEINACSIEIEVNVDGKLETWLLMFKNETHNHPTEIEPFGGAATCLGGAIRDPLSGRSYVYQAMRVTGSGDPRVAIDDTIQGKLPQRKITKEASKGFSSYGNQIGLATGCVREIYHEGYVAKRMEIGAVVGAVPKENVSRMTPLPGDMILLIGGKTGRDGCGGATGSSKAHTQESLAQCGAEVQKGNPPEERKLQRLFRNPEFSRKIKRCNDFGAGGVSVAIGELAESLEINLDAISKKYNGLDGTELAISESQERMAVVVSPEDVLDMISLSSVENIQATIVAKVTDNDRLIMKWNNEEILNISRTFLDTNGVKLGVDVNVDIPIKKEKINIDKSYRQLWEDTLKDLNVCNQKGLGEMFDSSIGAGTVLMPYGGKYQLTPIEGMVGKIPILSGDTDTCSIMSYGYNPNISEWSPFHGGVYSVVEAVSKIVALGGDNKKIRLSMQEYFEKLGKDPGKWGKPFIGLLGAYHAQKSLGIASIGGKDSMSGTFDEIHVPPTMVTFAICTEQGENIISHEFKKSNSKVYLIKVPKDENDIPVFNSLIKTYDQIKKLIDEKIIISANSIAIGGVLAAISKMSFGNKVGFSFCRNLSNEELVSMDIGNIIIETDILLEKYFNIDEIEFIGNTTIEPIITIQEEELNIDNLIKWWSEPLARVFPTTKKLQGNINNINYYTNTSLKHATYFGKPRVFIPVFPGSNCEYDSIKAFEKAGAKVDSFVFKNLDKESIELSISEMVKGIKESQILMIPGGFSGGDEPDGAGKFIATVFRNPYIAEKIMELIKQRDGLILGICNGFQALIKLGLLPYGDIRKLSEDSPTLTFNHIGRHVSGMSSTKIVSNLSPWFSGYNVGEIHTIPVSHGEGRFMASEDVLSKLINNGQIATQYVDLKGNATYEGQYNPNGSLYAVESITSPDGRVLGKMGHSERSGEYLYKNIPGGKSQNIFLSGVKYFV